jgi:hypothetical protein
MARESNNSIRGPYPYIDGLILRCTNSIHVLPVVHQERAAGKSGYTLRRLVRLWLNTFLNFSLTPLRFSTMAGFAIMGLGIILTIYVIVERFFLKTFLPPGWAFLAITVMFFSGTQLLIMGVMGEYLGRLFLSVNRTPQFAIREIHDGSPTAGQSELDSTSASQ